MTMFITGGTSSIGRILIKELGKEGTPMRVLVRRSSNLAGLQLPGVEFVFGDVTDPERSAERHGRLPRSDPPGRHRRPQCS